MKKYRIANKFRFITSLTVLILVVAIGAGTLLGSFNASGSDVRKYITVKVESGDTLWDLAKTYGPEGYDCRQVIYEIEKLNNVSAATLQAGQMLTIPTERL